MKFGISYFGPEPLFHLRRDFLLSMKYGLESLGHDVVLNGLSLESDRFNFVVGDYFLPAAEIPKIAKSGVRHRACEHRGHRAGHAELQSAEDGFSSAPTSPR